MSTTFNLAIDDIVRKAYLPLGGDALTGQNLRDAITSLNLLFIEWTSLGGPLAKVVLKTKTLTPQQNFFLLDQEDVDILDITINDNGSDIELGRISLSSYNQIPSKLQESRPVEYAVDRQLDQTKVLIWPLPPAGSTYTVTYYSITRIADVNRAYDLPDLNFRYLPAICAGLTWKLMLDNPSIPETKLDRYERIYKDILKATRDEDSEKVAYTVTPFAYNRSR